MALTKIPMPDAAHDRNRETVTPGKSVPTGGVQYALTGSVDDAVSAGGGAKQPALHHMLHPRPNCTLRTYVLIQAVKYLCICPVLHQGPTYSVKLSTKTEPRLSLHPHPHKTEDRLSFVKLAFKSSPHHAHPAGTC